MVRVPLTMSERERGQRLGAVLREARGDRSIVDVAAEAGISPETLRKIERGRIATPAFFTVVALVDALEIPIDRVINNAVANDPQRAGPPKADVAV
jgi:transcriptional regulator with XRE-family HTH domain